MNILYKALLIISLIILSSCSSTKYEKASAFKYYGYEDTQILDSTYEIKYKVNYKTSLRKCVDFALIRASKIALENNKDFLLKKLEAYRSYEKNPKTLSGTFVASSAVGEKYAVDRVGNAIIEIGLSNKGINSCALCAIISEKYGTDFFKKDFCNCTTNKDELVKIEMLLEKNYSKFNQQYLDKVFKDINPFDLDKAFNPEKEKY